MRINAVDNLPGFIKKTASYGIEKYIYSTYSPLSSPHL
jgi:hypothetical protein